MSKLNEFPKMLYKQSDSSNAIKIDGEMFETLIVEEDTETEALESGWTLSTAETKEDKPDELSYGDLKAKATELGLEFAGNIGKVKLSALIAEKEAEGLDD